MTIYNVCPNLNEIQNGLIIVGSLPHHLPRKPIYDLAEKLQWPIFSDIISGLRSDGSHENRIEYFETLLKMFPEKKADAILHLGDRFVSKPLLEWIGSKPYVLAVDHPFRNDPKHCVTHRLEGRVDLICEKLLPEIKTRTDTTWLQEWKEPSLIVKSELDIFFTQQKKWTEPGLIHSLQSSLSTEYALFIANSMPIRDANNFLFPANPVGPIFANRGVSGIDGNIATATGIAAGCKLPTIAIFGDQAMLHDLNSLSLLKTSQYPVIGIVLNNSGGGIFSFLPIAKRTDVLDEYFAAAHTWTFEHAAQMFNLPYYRDTLPSFDHSCIVEITTDRKENFDLHQDILCALKKSSSFCTAS